MSFFSTWQLIRNGVFFLWNWFPSKYSRSGSAVQFFRAWQILRFERQPVVFIRLVGTHNSGLHMVACIVCRGFRHFSLIFCMKIYLLLWKIFHVFFNSSVHRENEVNQVSVMLPSQCFGNLISMSDFLWSWAVLMNDVVLMRVICHICITKPIDECKLFAANEVFHCVHFECPAQRAALSSLDALPSTFSSEAAVNEEASSSNSLEQVFESPATNIQSHQQPWAMHFSSLKQCKRISVFSDERIIADLDFLHSKRPFSGWMTRESAKLRTADVWKLSECVLRQNAVWIVGFYSRSWWVPCLINAFYFQN